MPSNTVIGKLGCNPDFDIKTIYDLFDLIEKQPGLFIGYQTTTGLWHFHHGYRTAISAYHLAFEIEHPPFKGFHDFVAHHYGWHESTAGWCNIILKENQNDESKSLTVFFNLLAEYRRGPIPKP